MSHISTIYNQILHLIPRHQFESFVNRYNGDHYVKYYTYWQQFITLLYAQIKAKDSLRDIETSLQAQSSRWYHIGLKDIKRSTLSDAKHHEVKVAKTQDLPIIPDSIISVDRAYIDYKWLYSLKKSKVSFVTRAKSNMNYEVIGQHEVDKKKGLLFDKTVRLTGFYQSGYYPEPLRLIRLIRFKDTETKKKLIFLTNNFSLSAYTITQIYKARWQIELFFKWIKQNLKIMSFLGTSKNAVLTQIWVAMCYYLLLSYIKYQTKYSYTLLELSRIFSEVIFEKISLIDLLSCKYYNILKVRDPALQQSLF